MDVDEALAHVEDATPGEDVEAWIAKLLAAEVRELRKIRDLAARMIEARDAELEQADHFGRGEFRVTTWAYDQAVKALDGSKAEVWQLRMIERRAIEVYREPPVEPCDHVARGTAVRILGYRPNATEGEP